MNSKRILALVLIILSVFLTLVSVGGVIAIWVANGPITDSSMMKIQSAGEDLAQAADYLEEAQVELESAQAQIDIFQSILNTAGIEAVENAQVISDIVVKVEDTLTPLLDQASEGVNSIGELFDSIVETIEKLNDLPLVSLDIPGSEVLDSLSGSVSDLQEQIEDTKSKIESISQLTQDTVETLTTGFENWETLIAENLSVIDAYRGKIADYQAELAQLETNLPKWIDMASIALTLLLVWLAFTQIALFVLAWSFYKEEDLLMRWR